MLDKIQIVKPAEIEKRSMEIITSELNDVSTLLQILIMQIIYAFLKMLRISV